MAADEREAVSEALRLLAEADAGRGAPPRVEAAVLAAWRSRHAPAVADAPPASVSTPVSASEPAPLAVTIGAERPEPRTPAVRLGAMQQWAAALLAAVALSAAWELTRAPEPSSAPSGVSRAAGEAHDGGMAAAAPSRSRARSASRADGPGADRAGASSAGSAGIAQAGRTGDDDRRTALDAQGARGAQERAAAAAAASTSIGQGHRDDSASRDHVSHTAHPPRAGADSRTAGLDASRDRARAPGTTAPALASASAAASPSSAPMAAAHVPGSGVAAETAAFTPLPYVESLQPMEVPQVVRMAVPRDTAVQAGLFTRDRALPASGRVLADVLVGEDGVARGIRLVRQR